MLDTNSIPNDKHEATLFLKAYKLALLDISQEILDNDLNSISQVSGEIWNSIEKVDNQLEPE